MNQESKRQLPIISLTQSIQNALSGAALFVALTLLTLTPSAPAFALPSDKQQPIHISSDRAERNESLGLTTYSGSVEMTQGTLKILANNVVIHSTDNKVTKVIATGSPAEYQQVPSVDRQQIIARGGTIEYLISDDKLKLSKNASIQQSDGTTMSGDKINYDIKAAIVRANSSNAAKDRIHMVIPPKPDSPTEASN